MKNDNKLIFNTYARATGAYLLNEADQAEADQNLIKQNFAKQLEEPEVQQAMVKQAEELKAKYQAEIDKALEADGGTAGSNVEALLQKIQQEIEAQAQQQAMEQQYPPEDNTGAANESMTPMLDSEVEKYSALLNRR